MKRLSNCYCFITVVIILRRDASTKILKIVQMLWCYGWNQADPMHPSDLKKSRLKQATYVHGYGEQGCLGQGLREGGGHIHVVKVH